MSRALRCAHRLQATNTRTCHALHNRTKPQARQHIPAGPPAAGRLRAQQPHAAQPLQQRHPRRPVAVLQAHAAAAARRQNLQSLAGGGGGQGEGAKEGQQQGEGAEGELARRCGAGAGLDLYSSSHILLYTCIYVCTSPALIPLHPGAHSVSAPNAHIPSRSSPTSHKSAGAQLNRGSAPRAHAVGSRHGLVSHAHAHTRTRTRCCASSTEAYRSRAAPSKRPEAGKVREMSAV